VADGRDESDGWAQRLSAFGDVPTRALQGGMAMVPWFLEGFFIACWTLLFFVVAGEQRRAVCTNMAALFPRSGRLATLWRALRVFLNFAVTYVDAVRCEELGDEVDWAIDGVENFDDLAGRDEGCLILTAHMGNYDLAAPLFSGQFGRTVHAVRAPERDPRMQEIRERELRAWEARHPGFKVHYNVPGGMLGLELARILAAGDVVAVQADRVIFDVSKVEVPVEGGWHMVLPRGPLVLAQATGAPCFPLFVLRDGWRRYRVIVMPELKLPRRRRGDDGGEALAAWTGTLLGMVRDHWRQWFVFEPVFRADGS
jgi:lauroyl/myristoyl acyltransferase